MANNEAGEAWAAWLRDQFDRSRTIRIPADLVRAAGTKPNGRPVVDASRVTGWLRGQRPSYELALAAADAFSAPRVAALAAAGYLLDTPSGTVESAQQFLEPSRVPVGSGIDPELLDGLDPADVQRVEDFIRGMKAARGD